ncbi:acyl-CoA dehydrogenase family protein [Cryobacterium sp. SO2]|uniref:acyl-CoA dehydrogenase family protein n=1 Tax=Cryobacterium sp. SO2 TaxID=1897060 RepID=UPI00223E4409|nr:acyl-CoA dehydrogenase family protein [Cryobacterium sp. SO2]WEO78455.1 acyl-CoA dehydrogenase family protein [Cryobacterium sp. SO2]
MSSSVFSPTSSSVVAPTLLSDLSLQTETEQRNAEMVIAAARALRQELRQDQDAADDRGIYSAGIHRKMLEKGLYDITTPRAYGGLQLPLPVLMAVIVEIATGNPGSGWSFALAAQHTTTVAAHWPEEVQREALAGGSFLAPHQFARPGDVRAVDGGYMIDGDYPFSSGSPYSTHVMISAPVRDAEPGDPAAPDYVTLLIPREGYNVLDDWRGSFGMKASGSNTVRFAKRFVPGAWVIAGIGDDVTTIPGGVTLHNDGLYFGRLEAYHPVGLAAVAVGAARAAIEEFTTVVKSGSDKLSGSAKSDDPAFQYTLGLASARADAAEALVYAAVDAYTAVGRRHLATGVSHTRTELTRIAGLGTSAMSLAESAVDSVFEHIGTLRVVDGTRVQRYFRDVSTLRTHGRFHPYTVAVAHGVAMLSAP